MKNLPETRQSLLVRLSAGNADAWVQFLAIYESALYRYCRRWGFQDADARDVTQEILAAVDAQIGNFKLDPSLGNFRGWLFRVARNTAAATLRKHARFARASGDSNIAEMFAALPDRNDNRNSVFWYEYRRELMYWAAEKVRPDVKDSTWQSFWETAIEGKKAEVVAAQLGISVGNVYTNRCRVVARIRRLIEGLDQLPDRTDLKDEDGLVTSKIQPITTKPDLKSSTGTDGRGEK